jgi:hypothetical protein
MESRCAAAALYQGTTLQFAENSLDEGHGFTGCGKTHVLYEVTTLVGPKTARLTRALAPE